MGIAFHCIIYFLRYFPLKPWKIGRRHHALLHPAFQQKPYIFQLTPMSIRHKRKNFIPPTRTSLHFSAVPSDPLTHIPHPRHTSAYSASLRCSSHNVESDETLSFSGTARCSIKSSGVAPFQCFSRRNVNRCPNLPPTPPSELLRRVFNRCFLRNNLYQSFLINI